MTRIEVPGHFAFDSSGTVEFTYGETTFDFHRITTIDELRAVLVLIAQSSAQQSIDSILTPDVSEGSPGDVFARASDEIESVLEKSGRSFREHVKKTEDDLQRAQDNYEAATSTPATGA